ncbi:MAG: GTPase [Candidatus Hydrogenedentales bacterium]
MSKYLPQIIACFEELTAYDGPWPFFREKQKALRQCLTEIREKEEDAADTVIVALVGGSGVGKSTLLNAIAGEEIAETSEMRPCTSIPTVYYSSKMPEFLSKLGEIRSVSRSSLERVVLIDTPDTDTVIEAHRNIVAQVLEHCDFIFFCADNEKYLDKASWSLLYPFRARRGIVCVETRVEREDPAIKEHWLQQLEEEGFVIEHYFRINALNALKRKQSPSVEGNTFQFVGLEKFLQEEMNLEWIARVKHANVAGLFIGTVENLYNSVHDETGMLVELSDRIDQESQKLVTFVSNYFEALAPYRIPKIAQSLYARWGIHSYSARMLSWLNPLRRLLHPESPASDSARVSREIEVLQKKSAPIDHLTEEYQMLRQEIRTSFAHHGFDLPELTDTRNFETSIVQLEQESFQAVMEKKQGGWTILFEKKTLRFLFNLPPLAFFIYMVIFFGRSFFSGEVPSSGWILLGIIFLTFFMSWEIFVVKWGTRLCAKSTFNRGLAALEKTLKTATFGFEAEKKVLYDVEYLIERTNFLKELTVSLRSGLDRSDS